MIRSTALVTGGAGFIGKSLVRNLLKLDFKVIVLDDFSTSERMPSQGDLRVIEQDVITFNGIEEKIDIVYHLASLVGMELCYQDHQRSYDVITKGTNNIIALYPNIPKVFFSSSCVYGLKYSQAVNEETDIPYDEALAYDGGKLGYATGKWQMEKDIIEQCKSQDAIIVRPFNVAGHEQSASYGMVIPKFINAAQIGHDLTVYDRGEQIRCFSFIDDFVDTLISLAQSKESWKQSNIIFNIGHHQQTKIIDLAHLIISQLDSNSKIIYKNYNKVFPGKKDVQVRIPDTTKLENILGVLNWKSIEETVRSIIKQKALDGCVKI